MWCNRCNRTFIISLSIDGDTSLSKNSDEDIKHVNCNGVNTFMLTIVLPISHYSISLPFIIAILLWSEVRYNLVHLNIAAVYVRRSYRNRLNWHSCHSHVSASFNKLVLFRYYLLLITNTTQRSCYLIVKRWLLRSDV